MGGRLADVLPLSPPQEGLLFHAAARPGRARRLPRAGPVPTSRPGSTAGRAARRGRPRLLARHPNLRAASGTSDCRPAGPGDPATGDAALARGRPDRSHGPDEAAPELAAVAGRPTGPAASTSPARRCCAAPSCDAATSSPTGADHPPHPARRLVDAGPGPRTARAVRRPAAPTLPPAPPYRDYLAWLPARTGAAREAAWRRRSPAWTRPTLLGPATEPAPPHGPADRATRADLDELQRRHAHRRRAGRRA